MSKRYKNKAKRVANNRTKTTNKLSNKDKIDNKLNHIRNMNDDANIYIQAKSLYKENVIDASFFKYVINTLEDKVFDDVSYDKMNAQMLLENVCIPLKNVSNFKIEYLKIDTIGKHLNDENVLYEDKIITYNNVFVNIVSIEERNKFSFVRMRPMKFVRKEIVEALKEKYENGEEVQVSQYNTYLVVQARKHLKIYVKKQTKALATIHESIFDKIKAKIAMFLEKNPITKKKYLPELQLIYDSNPSRIHEIKTKNKSKNYAKNRMKVLLESERKITRSVSN